MEVHYPPIHGPIPPSIKSAPHRAGAIGRPPDGSNAACPTVAGLAAEGTEGAERKIHERSAKGREGCDERIDVSGGAAVARLPEGGTFGIGILPGVRGIMDHLSRSDSDPAGSGWPIYGRPNRDTR